MKALLIIGAVVTCMAGGSPWLVLILMGIAMYCD